METILIPTDFSPSAENAMRYAIELAKYFDSKLILVNAYPILPANYDTGLPLEMAKELQEASENTLNTLKVKYPDLEIECFSAMGYVYDVIEKAANDYRADLIVMGIIGEAGVLKQHLIGSTAIKVAKGLKIPTFIIPEGVRYQHIHKISFACDFDKTEETTLAYVINYFGKIFDAEIDIINVEKSSEGKEYEKWNTSEFLNKKLSTLKHKLAFVGNDDVTDGLEVYIKDHPTDVLMFNPKKHTVFQNLFNEDVTSELAFHAKLPLLVIH